jgi:hypothetical protein
MPDHTFHIPVMGTGFSLDTPLRVARFGIASVMSIVDDALVERVRRHYCAKFRMAYEPISALAPDSRARRITAWLDLVHSLIERQMTELRALPFAPGNEKTKYFELLPEASPSKRAYLELLAMPAGAARESAGVRLTEAMLPGPADVNIMTKLDRVRFDRDGAPLGPEQCDAKAALRGFAASRLDSNVVLSAGINPTLFGMFENLPAFYRDPGGLTRKGIILKVSDYRSALVQGRFLAKKGLEVREFRIESGLNCGGHAFATEGELLGPILAEFREARDSLAATFEPTVREYYEKKGWVYAGGPRRIRVTVQGGIGNFGEVRRLCEHYGADGTGWATPFLLVPEATSLDGATRKRLAAAREEDLYVSQVSPLGVPFNNLRGSSSELWTTRHIDEGRPGSSCPRGYLASNTEFTDRPICTASREYQAAKLAAMGHETPPPSTTADPRVRGVYDKTCICNHLGNGLLIDLGIARPDLPVAVCPGPNIAYFDREYTLREMIDHIYGRGPSLVPASRPHMLAKELAMYVDHFEALARQLAPGDGRQSAKLALFKDNLEKGLAHYRDLVAQEPFAGENLLSLAHAVDSQAARIKEVWRSVRSPSGEVGLEGRAT